MLQVRQGEQLDGWGENWEVVSKQLVASRHGTETLTARLNTAANSSDPTTIQQKVMSI